METIEIKVEKLNRLRHDLVRFRTLFYKGLEEIDDKKLKSRLCKAFKKVIGCLIEEIYDMVE